MLASMAWSGIGWASFFLFHSSISLFLIVRDALLFCIHEDYMTFFPLVHIHRLYAVGSFSLSCSKGVLHSDGVSINHKPIVQQKLDPSPAHWTGVLKSDPICQIPIQSIPSPTQPYLGSKAIAQYHPQLNQDHDHKITPQNQPPPPKHPQHDPPPSSQPPSPAHPSPSKHNQQQHSSPDSPASQSQHQP